MRKSQVGFEFIFMINNSYLKRLLRGPALNVRKFYQFFEVYLTISNVPH